MIFHHDDDDDDQVGQMHSLFIQWQTRQVRQAGRQACESIHHLKLSKLIKWKLILILNRKAAQCKQRQQHEIVERLFVAMS